MKICRFNYENQISWGVLKDEFIYPFEKSNFPPDLNNLPNTSISIEIGKVKFLPPVKPSKIVCVGRNYSEHVAELGNKVPREPLLFLKPSSSLITHGDVIVIPAQSNQVEHEGELAIVIKKTCKNLTEADDSFDYIFGYACLNDVTARDLQRQDVQFTRAKSFDTFCPIGASIETHLDVSDLRITTQVNGVIKQDGRTSQMVFSVPFLVRYISNQMTLNTGDIIATGTPSGVSRLKAGDICEVEIERIGTLRNFVK